MREVCWVGLKWSKGDIQTYAHTLTSTAARVTDRRLTNATLIFCFRYLVTVGEMDIDQIAEFFFITLTSRSYRVVFQTQSEVSEQRSTTFKGE